MVRVRIERAADGLIRGFAVRGHAGFGARGQDIVCAAVSALTQTAVLALERRLGVPAEVAAGPGILTCRLPAGMNAGTAARAQDALETMCLGLREIAHAYPAGLAMVDGVVGPAADADAAPGAGVPRGRCPAGRESG